MNDELTAELTRIFAAITIYSPSSFSFAGKLVNVPDSTALPGLPFHPQLSNGLTSLLQQMLYQYAYCQRFTGELPLEAPPEMLADDLTPTLAAANASRERWDAGWQIQQLLPTGQVAAVKGGQLRLLWPGEFHSHDAPGMAPRMGAPVSLFAAKEARTAQTGFYFAYGEHLADQQSERHLVRFYWNVNAAGAPALMQAVTGALNRFQLPFRCKCATYSGSYFRTDAAVLYVSQRYFHLTAELLAEVYNQLHQHLEAATPLFSKQLRPGLGLAEDPPTGESFGTSRCRLLAESIWHCYEQGEQTATARLAEVTRQFASNGLSLERPYLNAGTKDIYDFPADRR